MEGVAGLIVVGLLWWGCVKLYDWIFGKGPPSNP